MRISDWSSDVCSSDLYPRCYRVSPAQMGNRPPYASGCSGGGSRQRDVRISASVDAGCFQAPKHSMPKGYRRTMKRENAAECFCKVVDPRLAKHRTPQQSPGRKPLPIKIGEASLRERVNKNV